MTCNKKSKKRNRNMKRQNYLYMAAALLLAGCSIDEQSVGTDGLVPVRLTATQDAGGVTTRTTSDLHSASTGFAVNETMKVFMKNGETTNSSIYKVASVSSGTATLTDNGTKLYYPTGTTGSVSLYAVYPAGITASSTHTVAYDQTTDANYNASDLMFSTEKSVSLSDKTTTQSLTAFAHKMVRLKLNIIKSSDVASVTEVKMKNVKRQVTVSALSESGITLSAAASPTDETGTGANKDEILIFSGTNSSTSTQTYYVVFPKQLASGNDWNDTDFITVTAAGSTATYQLTKAFTAGSQYELTLNINAASLGSTVSITGWTDTQAATVSPTETVETPLPDRTPSGVVAVDLGLSVKWANMNIGATSVTGYGFYFAWGETTGYGSDTSDGRSFNWASYKWGISSTSLTKYNTKAANGTVDNRTKLEFCDDAAYAAWGGAWRMPSKAEWEELKNTDNCTWEWKTDYNGSGVGYLVTSKKSGYTSNYIFLPAAGYRYDASVSGRGEYGRYWSSSLSEGYPSGAWYLYFGSGGAYVYYDNRYYGYTVRAVQ